MTIYKRGRVWWVEYMVDGKRYRQSTHSRNKAVAQAFADNIKTANKMPTFEDALHVLKILYRQKDAIHGIQLAAIWETYENTATLIGKNAITQGTREKRKNSVDRFIKWLKKNRPTVKSAEAVTAPIAAGFAQELTAKGLKSKTRINIISDLGTVWKMLCNSSASMRDPWGNLRPQNVDGEAGKAFTTEHEERVLEASKRVGKLWYEVCKVMRGTGQRYGDVARLKWDAVDFVRGTISFIPNKTKRHNIAVVLPLLDELRDVLLSIRTTESPFVFPIHAKYYGDRGRASREALCFREVLEAAGLENEGYTIHSWRHTTATRLGATGASKETRKQILGHTTDAMAEHYDHDEHLAEKRKALEAAAGITSPSSL